MTAKRLGIAVLLLSVSGPAGLSQGVTIRPNIGGNRRQQPEEKTKSIHGVVQDTQGKTIAGARVQIRSSKDNTARLATTDANGTYAIRGLPPDADYEVRADLRGVVSERKIVSALMNREDNLVNLQLDMPVAQSVAASDAGPELQTHDLVRLKASFEIPRGVPAPIPAVLLLHGYGEDRRVWEAFRTQLLARGWAVMSLDLRGHGDSKMKNQRPLAASPEWRSSPHEFTQDIDPALDWLKKQTRLDSRRIAIVGYDIGANLALIASGKFTEVRTVIAVKPNLKEALEMAGSAQDFQPRSVLLISPDASDGAEIKPYLKQPFRQQVLPLNGGTSQLFQSPQLADAVFQWLKETY